MSKELEALNGIKMALAKHLSKQTGLSVERHFELLDSDTQIETIKKALTPPTEEEVCEALNLDKRLFPKIYFYDEISKTFKEIHLSRNEEIVSYYADGTITINPNYGIPPHLITMIGRFYEGVIE